MDEVKREPSVGQKMFCAGLAACVADLFTFPFDVAKVRLQILGENSKQKASVKVSSVKTMPKGLLGTLSFIHRTEGIRGLYGGIVPGLQRQCVFASIRIGIYDSIKNFYSSQLNLGDSTTSIMCVRIMSGITSGAIAISFAQPTDVVKVRMQAQSRLIGSSSQYTSSLSAYRQIYKSEGVGGLWKGILPNMTRNATVNAAELVCYDTIKDLLIKYDILRDGLCCHFTSAFGAGFIATIVASPIDVVKTRFMNSAGNQYSGVLHCAKCLFMEGGFLGFYKGFTPSFMRLGTWNICMFVTFEQLKKLMTKDFSDTKALFSSQQILQIASRNEVIPATNITH
ncbi:mitochondrial uncoupling protein 2-like protein [Leptotrombidium deliense]|uniref:Mitochondrial uncoupling protein 2-like protein n=1 Tax=Leptotrombidium deliense TaxID=299467 RepID=A0A443SCD0_9ACAR|nr:mitochondrial uncoupling protein 2-like protein [Leptotrombidium deliense]